MNRDPGLRALRNSRGEAAAARSTGRRFAHTPGVESLEGRTLLSSFFSGPTPIRPVLTSSGVVTLTMNGPGLEIVKPVGHGLFAVTLFGTTSASTLNITSTYQRPHKTFKPLQIASIRVVTGQIGGINATGAADLLGAITPLPGSVGSLQFNSLGPNARIDVGGTLGVLGAGSIDLGPSGHVKIGDDLGQSLAVGALVLDGGQLQIGHDLTGSLSVGNLSLSHSGQFQIGHDLTGGGQVSGNVSVTDNSLLFIGHDLVSGLNVTQGVNLDNGGRIIVGNDVTGNLSVGGSLSLSNGALLNVGRDLAGTLSITGDLALAAGAALDVGRDLNALLVGGNLTVAPSGGSIAVGGNLSSLKVHGYFQGQGSKTNIDLNVGLDLDLFTVLGGLAGQGGISDANINVGKSILGLDVRHGIFNSLITAGVLIDGSNANGIPGGNIGADGADSVYNSEIRAGVNIRNLTINGNVRSTFAVDPNSTGYPTRIVAGEDRAGVFSSGGVIDNFQITGTMYDSVLAASVQPFGGQGTLPPLPFPYGPAPTPPGPGPGDLGNNTYDAPAGTITGGTVAMPHAYPNFSEVSYYNETLTGVAYNHVQDPTIDDYIYPGAINPSFASPPVPASSLSDGATVLPLPTKSTVLGGVVSTVHGDEADFAGIFAADARGVFVGALPS